MSDKPPPKHNPNGYYARADWFEARCTALEAALTLLTDGWKYSTEVVTIARNALASEQSQSRQGDAALTPRVAATSEVVSQQPQGIATESPAPIAKSPGWADSGPFIFGKDKP